MSKFIPVRRVLGTFVRPHGMADAMMAGLGKQIVVKNSRGEMVRKDLKLHDGNLTREATAQTTRWKEVG